MATTKTKPRLAVFKLASCDGCQLTLLDCEDELLALAGQVTIAHFTEASSAVAPGPYDVSIVEGSITTQRDVERIHQIRDQSRVLIAIGACAISGGPYRDSADVHNGVEGMLPVDLYIPGCPPHPLTILDGLLRLIRRIGPETGQSART